MNAKTASTAARQRATVLASVAIVFIVLGAASCSDDTSERNTQPVGQQTFVIEDAARERELRVEVWYPGTEELTETEPIEALSPPDQRELMEDALSSAPEDCVTRETGAQRDGRVNSDTSAPLILFSHCLGCMRFSSFSLAEALAGQGYVVAAVDHAGDTFFDENEEGTLNSSTLEMRVADLRFLLDVMLDEVESDVPGEILSIVDAARVGLFGHSFGAVTAGTLAQRDERVDAVAGLAAPFDGLNTAAAADFDVPVLQVIAEEDHSISFLGNLLLSSEHEDLEVPAALLSLTDAGHWSVSDIAGLTEMFMPGCGDDTRERGGGTFSYPPADEVLDVTGRALVAFFDGTIRSEDVDIEAVERAVSGAAGVSDLSIRNAQ